MATMLTGFGPFVAVYLTSQHWTQLDIGVVLTVAGLVSLVAQVPGGALVDAARSERLVAGLAIAAIGLSALALGLWPTYPAVQAVAVAQAAAASVIGPATAAISLGLVGMMPSANGSAAMPALHRWAPASAPPSWAQAGICSANGPSSSCPPALRFPLCSPSR